MVHPSVMLLLFAQAPTAAPARWEPVTATVAAHGALGSASAVGGTAQVGLTWREVPLKVTPTGFAGAYRVSGFGAWAERGDSVRVGPARAAWRYGGLLSLREGWAWGREPRRPDGVLFGQLAMLLGLERLDRTGDFRPPNEVALGFRFTVGWTSPTWFAAPLPLNHLEVGVELISVDAAPPTPRGLLLLGVTY